MIHITVVIARPSVKPGRSNLLLELFMQSITQEIATLRRARLDFARDDIKKI